MYLWAEPKREAFVDASHDLFERFGRTTTFSLLKGLPLTCNQERDSFSKINGKRTKIFLATWFSCLRNYEHES